MRHLRIDEVHCPFRELEEGEEIHWNASQTSLYEDQSTSVREKFAPPPSNPFNDFIQKGGYPLSSVYHSGEGYLGT